MPKATASFMNSDGNIGVPMMVIERTAPLISSPPPRTAIIMPTANATKRGVNLNMKR